MLSSEPWGYPYFTRKEMSCRCGCQGVPPDSFMKRLVKVRVEYGIPMIISSAYRCPEYNDLVSESGFNGPHTRGAIDTLVYRERALKLIQIAVKHGFTGIGVSQKGPLNQRFIHLDDIASYVVGFIRPNIWSY